MPFVSKQQRELRHRGAPIRVFELDFLADDKVITELKCLRCGFLPASYVGFILSVGELLAAAGSG